MAKNDVTGDSIVSKKNTDAYRDNWDRIFGSKKSEVKPEKTKEATLTPRGE